MKILITNDDGYKAKGIHVLAEVMSRYGDVVVIAPKTHQSGMSVAVSLGFKQLGYKELPGEGPGTWSYLNATPASCIKYGMNFQFLRQKPDVVVCGINHGANASSAACYSGTLGAAQEAAINGVPAIGVSLNDISSEADFSCVERYFPQIFERIMANLPERYGIFYNVNFPKCSPQEIKGIRIGYQGRGRWVREFMEWDPELLSRKNIKREDFDQPSGASAEPGEKLYMMVGDFQDDSNNTELADHHLLSKGFISVSAQNIDYTDYAENERIQSLGFNQDFKTTEK